MFFEEVVVLISLLWRLGKNCFFLFIYYEKDENLFRPKTTMESTDRQNYCGLKPKMQRLHIRVIIPIKLYGPLTQGPKTCNTHICIHAGTVTFRLTLQDGLSKIGKWVLEGMIK